MNNQFIKNSNTQEGIIASLHKKGWKFVKAREYQNTFIFNLSKKYNINYYSHF